jgi:hypothetical protein
MEDDGIFNGHLVHFTVFCYILWTNLVQFFNLVYFSRFGILYQEKSGNPAMPACSGFLNKLFLMDWVEWVKSRNQFPSNCYPFSRGDRGPFLTSPVAPRGKFHP